jgi:hypothetical protein
MVFRTASVPLAARPFSTITPSFNSCFRLRRTVSRATPLALAIDVAFTARWPSAGSMISEIDRAPFALDVVKGVADPVAEET